MKIGIVGVGMVGGTIRDGFQRIGHSTFVHDKKMHTLISDVIHTELIFICVPTPESPSGHCFTATVENVLTELADHAYTGLVVIKSTVPPGFTHRMGLRYKELRIAYCPEFLREKAAHTDFIDDHDVCIIGCHGDTAFELIKEAHGRLPKKFVKVTPIEAEFAKYFANVFNALRIIFANEFYEVCITAGADYTAVKNAITQHHNIPDYYLECNKNLRAFGGSCLPKDTLAFAKYVQSLDLPFLKLFEYIVEANQRIKDLT